MKIQGLAFIFFLLGASLSAVAQDTPQVRYQVAVFTPLYLDSAFDETTEYRYGKAFPKFINPGLEFYEGVELAIDSLNSEGLPLDVYIYDSRSATSTLQDELKKPGFDSIDLVIGHVNAKEARQIANAVAKKNIPFINANYPNDAGVTNNPNYIILNSTLQTHFNAIYRFIQKNHSLAPVIMFGKKGAQEERIKKIFDDIGKTTGSVPLKIKYVALNDYFTVDDVKKHLDEDATTVCIAGSFDVNFGKQLTAILASVYEQQSSILFAMPTWWEVTDFSTPDFKGVEVFYTTPFYLSDSNALGSKITQDFKTRFYSRPTDMYYRGFETLYHFAHLLQLHGKNLGSSLSDKRSKIFTNFDIQPVINPKTNTLDYFENKKIYFIKKVNGAEIAVY
jgi:ABC-type branched-subunit amino acid transport system substrate-binding protein